jgi:transposase
MSMKPSQEPTAAMPTSPTAPDLAQLRAWLEQMVAALRFVELIAAVLTLITRLRDLNSHLILQIASLRQARPKSETLRRLERQLTLPFPNAAVPASGAKGAEGSEQKGAEKRPRRRPLKHPGRARIAEHIERTVVPNDVPPQMRRCPTCGRLMTTVGYSITETLELIPARVVAVQRKDETCACPHDDTIVSAPTPPEIVERGKLGPVLIVESTANKFLDHQPIERQCRDWSRRGVDIAPQTLGRAAGAEIDLLAPIAQAIRNETRASALLGTDGTAIPILDRSAPEGIRMGTMWCWIGDERWVTFEYAPVGDAVSVMHFLGSDHRRTVQCDGASVFSFIERAGGKRPGCWAHGRRRFVFAVRGGDTLALVGLKKLRRLFAVDRLSAIHGETPEQRQARRLEHSKPVLDELKAWVDEQRALIPPKTPLGRALGYLHRQWSRLCVFLEDGRIELTNNRVEREVRSLVLGRNYGEFPVMRSAQPRGRRQRAPAHVKVRIITGRRGRRADHRPARSGLEGERVRRVCREPSASSRGRPRCRRESWSGSRGRATRR